jgi:hypothetical protein
MISEIRYEDLGKKIFASAEPIDKDIINNITKEFFTENNDDCYLLYSQEINYFTVFRTASETIEQINDNFIQFLKESQFTKMLSYNNLWDIVEIEYNRNHNTLEIWAGKAPTYFQLMSWGDSCVSL